MRSRKLSFILVLSVLVTTVGGCGSKDASQQNDHQGLGTEAVDTESGTQTYDNYGRKITVTGKPSKVLTFGPNCTELFCALGLEEYVIGDSLNNHSRGALPEYKEAYENIPELNHSSATRDAVLSSGADFIYGIDWEFGEEALDVNELQDYGITTYMNKATTLDDIYQEITDIGEIFGIEDRADKYIDDQKTRIQAVEDKIADQKPLKVLVYDSGNDGVFTCGGTNFESLLIGLAGGDNIFADQTAKQWITVSYEEVIDRKPDIILIHDYDSPSVEEKIAEIKGNPVLSGLDCVKNERFAVITLESVLPGDRMAYAVETMAKAFYPTVFAQK